mgnify:CR=1 FL=1
MKKDSFLKFDKMGEFRYERLNDHNNVRFKADDPMDNPVIPYLIMLFCAIIDLSVFYGFFQKISYDSDTLQIIQTGAMLFAFDVIPIYLGIHLKKLRCNMEKKSFMIWLGVGVCLLGVILNIVLRIITVDLTIPDDGEKSMALAMEVFGIIGPVITSAGSFYSSHQCCHPLKTRQCRLAKAMTVKLDEIRRLEAMMSEYEAEEQLEDRLMEDDREQMENMKRLYRAKVLYYCDWVRQRLKEHLGDPTSNNALSKQACITLLQQLDEEMAAFENMATSMSQNSGE